MWNLFFFWLIHLNVVCTSSQNGINSTLPVTTTQKPGVPVEVKLTRKTDRAFCQVGSPIVPTKTCQQQQDCQTPMKLNLYCSHEEICCEEDPEGNESLCFDRRLPLFGEPACSSDSECNNYGAICKSGHCCPNFHYKNDEPFQPPSHFYVSNFSCVPGESVPAGFQFAYCSNISGTIAYLGVVNKCGDIQSIHKYSKCQKDLDCFPGNICVQTINEGMCFKNPEDCSNSIYYTMTVTFCYLSFVMMVLYYASRVCYEHPLRVNQAVSFLKLLPYNVTRNAEKLAFSIYGSEYLTRFENEKIVNNAARRAWDENERSLDRPALEYVLNWMGYVVQDSDYSSSDEG